MSAPFTLPIPTYQSNARVQALKIKAIIPNPRGYELHFEDERFCPHLVGKQWLVANGAGAGGYAVWSIGGYLGFQNAATFEDGHTLVETADGAVRSPDWSAWPGGPSEVEGALASRDAEIERLRGLLRGCVEHMEYSTPQGGAAWDAANKETGPATQDAREVIDEAAEMRRAEWHAEMRADAFGHPHE